MSGYRAMAFTTLTNECADCGHPGNNGNALEVHHVDRYRKNNNITNLRILCQQCHRAVHRPPGTPKVVSMSFTAPLPITQWVQEYMREENLGRSAVIVKALEQLRERVDEREGGEAA